LSVVVLPAPLAPSRVVIWPVADVDRHALEDEDDAVVDDFDVVDRQHREVGRRSLAARPFSVSGLRGFGREVLLDQRAIALEPRLGPLELAALDGPDLDPAAAFVVGGVISIGGRSRRA
jgi:hypothetical protein